MTMQTVFAKGMALCCALILTLGVAGCNREGARSASDAEQSAASLERARQLIQEGNYEAALLYLNQALAASPRDPEVHLNLGWLYLYTNELPKAKEELEKLAALAPNSPKVHHLKGGLFAKLDQHEDALPEYRRALDREPGNSRVYFDMAASLSALNRNEQALEYLEQGYDRIPQEDLQSHVNFLMAACAAEARLKRFEEAIADCQQAAEYTSSEEMRRTIDEMIQNMQLIRDIDEDLPPAAKKS